MEAGLGLDHSRGYPIYTAKEKLLMNARGDGTVEVGIEDEHRISRDGGHTWGPFVKGMTGDLYFLGNVIKSNRPSGG